MSNLVTRHTDDIARADRLAALLSDARGAETLAELQKAARRRPREPQAPVPGAAPAPASASVGVWDLRPGPDGVELHRRDVDGETARYWADVPHVPGKAAARRVVLAGESAARGFLLDPGLTPADALRDELAGATRPVQVVDLARTGASITDLAAVVASLPHLDADALVLFAGNNWSLQNLTVADHDRLAESLRLRGLAGMRDTFTRRIVLPRVRALLRRVERMAHEGPGLDVVVVIPEFNLCEWQADPSWETALLPPERADEWARLRLRMEAAQGAGRWTDVVRAAERMAALDGGTSSVPGRALAAAHLQLGDPERARTALEEARDSVTGMLVAHTPRITALIQAELSAFADRGGHALVDLRTELADPATGLPDPACFLDYCHLSPQGTERAMRAVARRLDPEGNARSGGPHGTGDARVRSVGHLLAAIHGAWLGQPAEVVARQLDTALTEDPAVVADLSDLLGLLAKGVPAWLTPEYDRLCALPHAERYLNPVALRDLGTLARTVLPSELARVLGRPAPLPAHAGDLLAGRLDSAPRIVNGREAAYHRSAVPVFRARLDGARKAGSRLLLTYRTPSAAVDAVPGTLEYEGHVLAVVDASPRTWRPLEVRLPAAGDGGTGELRLHWPAVEHDEASWREQGARTLATGGIPLPVPVYGELFEARVLSRDDR
ncbi:hypothetical protein [Streptomyces sp. NBC_00272]|uniref:hypothetical protein n=1 Tax=Streptomyces sp. NBC_00272 TaxID=2975698 RepID=UPI002E294AC0|nr:hypothetical protein [Streptomyces sp. NBC_00272]